MKNSKPVVIFDFDGTIADSFEYVFAFLRAEARNTATFTPEEEATYRSKSMKDMALVLGNPAWRLPFLFFKGRRVMREHLASVTPFAGMPEIIEQLHADGHRLFIVSANSNRNIRRFLKQHDLKKYITGIRGNAGILGKVAILRGLLRRYRISSQNCWYVGDEVSDMTVAKIVGVSALAVTWGFADRQALIKAADIYIDEPSEILNIVR